MPPIPFADNFLAGSLLTIFLPLGLLIAITIWYLFAVRRVPADTSPSAASLPSDDGLAAASDAGAGEPPAVPEAGES